MTYSDSQLIRELYTVDHVGTKIGIDIKMNIEFFWIHFTPMILSLLFKKICFFLVHCGF